MERSVKMLWSAEAALKMLNNEIFVFSVVIPSWYTNIWTDNRFYSKKSTNKKFNIRSSISFVRPETNQPGLRMCVCVCVMNSTWQRVKSIWQFRRQPGVYPLIYGIFRHGSMKCSGNESRVSGAMYESFRRHSNVIYCLMWTGVGTLLRT